MVSRLLEKEWDRRSLLRFLRLKKTCKSLSKGGRKRHQNVDIKGRALQHEGSKCSVENANKFLHNVTIVEVIVSWSRFIFDTC